MSEQKPNTMRELQSLIARGYSNKILRIENPEQITVVYPNGNVVKTKKSQSKTKPNEQTNN